MLDPVTQARSPEAHPTHSRRSSPLSAGTEKLPDLLLIERARGGDESAIEALVRRFARRLFRVARSVVPDEDRAESVVQDAYLAAFADLSRYEPTGKFGAWLTRLTYQQARMQRSAVRYGLPLSPLTGSGGTPAAQDGRERGELEGIIGTLPEVFRTVFVLRVVEGVSGIETAACLGIHETTVRTRLYRAHRRLGAETVQRIRALPALLEPAPVRLERLLSKVATQRLPGTPAAKP